MKVTEILVPEVWRLRSEEGQEITKKINVSPELAKEMMEAWPYRGQRKIRSSRVTTYLRQIESGDWKYRTEMLVGVLPNGEVHLLNGYHRLTALVELTGKPVSMPVRLVFSLLEDSRDAADYYGVMDIGGPRSPTDAIVAQGLAEEWGVSIDTIRAAGAAGALILSEFSGGRSNSWHSAAGRSIPARMQFIREWEQEIRIIDGLLKLAPAQIRKIILRQPVMAVMLLTVRHTPDKADEFWSSVISGEGLWVGMPAMTLRNYLITTGMRGVPEHVYARYVANCWNGFYRKEKMIRVQVKSGGLADPIVIEGTPFTRSRREKERLLRIESQKLRAAHARDSRNQQRKIEKNTQQEETVIEA